MNYRGWGDANGWHYPEFHVDDVNDLNNGWLTPVFFSYVCNSNDFANNVDPCLAEAVIRGGTPSVPKGGVAFMVLLIYTQALNITMLLMHICMMPC